MTLSGRIHGQQWDVDATTAPASEGGFCCRVQVSHAHPEGRFEHGFAVPGRFATEREAMLAGLREGMVWIELKVAGTIGVT